MQGPTQKMTKEPPKRANHKGNIKFPNPLQSKEAYQIRKGEDLLKGGLAQKNPHLQQQPVSKQRSPASVQMPLTPFAYKMHMKLRKEGLWCPLLPHAMLTHQMKKPISLQVQTPKKSLELEGEQIANTGLHLAQVVGISIGTLSPSTIPICFMFLWVEWETIDTNVQMR